MSEKEQMADAGLEERLPAEIATIEGQRDPYSWFKEKRQESSGVYYDEDRDIYDVLSYEAVSEMAIDYETFGREGTTYIDGAWQSREPPMHTDLRRMADKYFRENYLKDEMREYIKDRSEELVDEALESGDEFDFVEEVAEPLPRLVIADMLGIREHQMDDFLQYSEHLIVTDATHTSDDDVDEAVSKRQEAVQGLLELFEEEVAYREENPQDDMITIFLQAEDEFERITRKNTLACCAILLAAGNHSTTVFLTNSLWTFLEEDVIDDLQSGDLDLRESLEEVLRYRSAVTTLKREATEDTELAGTEIPEGATVYGWLNSANRDEEIFENPDEFDPTREYSERPIPFGKGIHHCLGDSLARLEGRVLYDEFLDRVDSVELTKDSNDLEPIEAFIVYGVEELPIRIET